MSDIKMSNLFIRSLNFNIKEFVEDDKKVNNYDRLAEENAQLKADKAELLEAANGILNVIAESRGVSGYRMSDNVEDWWDFDEICNLSELIQNHKE